MVRCSLSAQHRQRGAASVVIAILFLVIAGYAAVAALDMSATTVSDASVSESGAQAQFLAESGLEVGFQIFKSGAACSSVATAGAGPYSLGAGQFSIETSTVEGSNCRITAVGEAGTARRSATGVAIASGFDYAEQFLNIAAWTANFTPSNKGTNGYDSANCTVCAGAAGGSLLIRTNPSGNNDRHRGYLATTFASPLNSGGGVTVTVTFGYKKQVANANASAQSIALTLYSSNSRNSTTLWSHTTISNANTWISVDQTVTLPAGEIYDELWVEADLQENGNRQINVWIDEITISY